MKKQKKLIILIIVVIIVGAFLFINKKDNSTQLCGIEQCHGLELTCGSNIPEICTKIYQLGDFCSQYFKCGITNNKCGVIDDSKFNECKSCVEKCNNMDAQLAFNCETQCRDKFNQ